MTSSTPRVLFTCWPFEGHVMPQMSIAAELQAQGAEVAFYTAASAHPLLESAGMTAFPFERVKSVWKGVQERERAVGGRGQPRRVHRQAYREWLIGTVADQVADLEDLIRRWEPDVIVTDLTMWGPITVLWEKTGIPVVLSSTMMGPMTGGRDAPPRALALGPPRTRRQHVAGFLLNHVVSLLARGGQRHIDQLRARHGLPPMGCSVTDYTGRLPLHLVMGIRELDFGRRDMPGSVRYVGACSWHPQEPPGTAEWLDRIDTTRPWVHITEGTSHFSDPFVLRAASHGLADRPVEAILTTGSGKTSGELRDPQALGLRSASNVHVTNWLSHGELLPRCSVVVTTGGPGTIMAALRAGVPLVVVPTSWDKPLNARRVADAGVGVRLPPGKCTPDTLRDAVERVLGDASYRVRAQQMAEALEAAPGPAGAARMIAGLVAVTPEPPAVPDPVETR
jgi:MGT family glycosyltransferase